MSDELKATLTEINPDDERERAACVPKPVDPTGFNRDCVLRYGLATEHIYLGMCEFVNFLGFINQQLNTRALPRLESMLMQANFSSIVGEFMSSTIGAALTEDDWKFSGRSDNSRRTITASVSKSGYQKMQSNWIYRDQ